MGSVLVSEDNRSGPAGPDDESTAGQAPAPDAAPRRVVPRRRVRSRVVTSVVVVVVVLLMGGFFLWRYLSSYESTDDAQVDVHLYPVSARIGGHVIRVSVNDNEYVEQGDVLVEIDPQDYRVAVDKARADLANAEATAQSLNITVPITAVSTSSQLMVSASDVENAGAGIIAAEKQLAAAHAQVEEAEANEAKARDDLKRYKLLVDKQDVSEQTYDQALAAAKATAAGVAAAQANEAATQQGVRQARNRLSQAEASHRTAQTGPRQVASTRARALSALAEVQQRRAALEQTELNLQYTKVVAPISGSVTKTAVVGMNVQAGQQLLTIVPLDDVWITANFKETQLTHMRPGQRVDVDVDSNGRTYRGSVDSIGGATGPLFSLLPPENATGNFVKIVQRIPVKIVLEPGGNRDRQLRPGMSVEPRVYLR
jgi:membrane fusion protein (multidrug efflux system)